MADYNGTIRTAQLEARYKRNAAAGMREVHNELRIARLTYTFDGTEATTEVVDLACLGIEGAILLPHLSYASNDSSTDIDISFNLSANIAGVETAVSAVLAFDNTIAPFVRIEDQAPAVLAAADTVGITFVDAGIGSRPAGAIIMIEVAYLAPTAL